MDLFQRQQFLTISVLKALDTVKLNLKLTSQVPDDITASSEQDQEVKTDATKQKYLMFSNLLQNGLQLLST